MTLKELYDAIHVLLEDEGKNDEPVCIEIHGGQYQLKSISVIVASDIWMPETIVASVEEIEGD